MMQLPTLDLVTDAVSLDAVIDRSIHESISLYVMILDRKAPKGIRYTPTQSNYK